MAQFKVSVSNAWIDKYWLQADNVFVYDRFYFYLFLQPTKNVTNYVNIFKVHYRRPTLNVIGFSAAIPHVELTEN